MGLVTSSCAVCRGVLFDCVYPSTISRSDDSPADYYSSSRRVVGHLDVVRCRQCGLMLTSPRDDDDTLDRVYRTLADASYTKEWVSRRHIAERRVAAIMARAQEPGTLLDIGSSTGIFVEAAHERGWTATGLDPSAWAIEQARQRCPGATFHVGMIEAGSFPRESFDVITLWDVLEHVRDPAQTLELVHQWLAPGGWLYLNVPNSASLTARFMGRSWVLLLREHLWYFSPHTLGLLLAKAGFAVVETRPNYVQFSLANIAGRLGQYRGPLAAVARSLARRPVLRRGSVRFPIGEMIAVARKAKATEAATIDTRPSAARLD